MAKESFNYEKHTGFQKGIWEIEDIISEEELKEVEQEVENEN